MNEKPKTGSTSSEVFGRQGQVRGGFIRGMGFVDLILNVKYSVRTGVVICSYKLSPHDEINLERLKASNLVLRSRWDGGDG